MLSVIAIIGLGPRLNNVRFSAAVHDLESSIASNLADVSRGANMRGGIKSCQLSGNTIVVDRSDSSSPAGSSSNCVVNGVVAVFDYNNNRILYRSVVSLREPVTSCTDTGFRKVLVCNKATLLDESQSPSNKIYNYINGIRQTNPTSNTGFGYVQDPNGSTVYPFRATPLLFFSGGMASTLTTSAASDTKSEFCYTLGSRQAKLAFNNTSLKPEVKYGEPCS